MKPDRIAALGAVAALLAAPALAQEAAGGVAVTIYSRAVPGAVPPELYRPIPGQGNPYVGASVPGYGIVRQNRSVDLTRGVNRVELTDVAAYIDPTTVSFESLTAPGDTRVVEQSFEFDLVSTDKLLERYIGETIDVEQVAGGDGRITLSGTLLGTQGGVLLRGDDGRVHALNSYQNVHFPELPGGLKTRPTLVWDVATDRAGRHDTRVAYETSGITWWADYNLVFSAGANENAGFLDVGAWVSILNRSGASYPDARLKLIAGDVARAEPPMPMRRDAMRAFESAAAVPGFQEQSFFEFHLYTLGRPATIPDNSTKQIELFPKVSRVPAAKKLVYYGLSPDNVFPNPVVDRDIGLPTNTKVDVYLELENSERAGLGMPLPAGRIRVSQLNPDDGSLELIGEDVLDHTPKDETVTVRLGSAFDVVGERRQVSFAVDGRRIDETIEVKVRNHKDEPVDVLIRETLFRWGENDVSEASHRYERLDARTVEFPVTIPRDGEVVVTYRVRYRW